MSPLVLAVVAAVAVDGGGIAIALDDGTVWIVHDREWEELGGCEIGEVVALEAAGDELAIECGDGTTWAWSEALGWQPTAAPEAVAADLDPWRGRSWWPSLELTLRMRDDDRPAYEGWIRLRWDL